MKAVFEGALKKGLNMAKQPHSGPAAEEQWNALACTVQLAVHCLGISYCFEKVCKLRACSECCALYGAHKFILELDFSGQKVP